MKQLSIAEMQQLVEISPKAWEQVADQFNLPIKELKQLFVDGAVWESFTKSRDN